MTPYWVISPFLSTSNGEETWELFRVSSPLQGGYRDGLWHLSLERGWGTHVNPWLIHVNVWQKPLQHSKVISLQLIKINEKKKKKERNRGRAHLCKAVAGKGDIWPRDAASLFLPEAGNAEFSVLKEKKLVTGKQRSRSLSGWWIPPTRCGVGCLPLCLYLMRE